MKKENILKTMITLTITAPLLTGCSQSLNVKNDMKVEFGTPISTNVADYLNNEKTDKDELSKILAETKLEIIGDKKVENKDYQQVGDYKVKLTYDNEEVEVNVSVKDTTKPVFKDFKDTVDTYKDVKVDFTKLFKADDLSQVTITGDDKNVDYTKEGSYKATVTATDEGKNTETKEVTINVKKPEIKLDKTSKSVYVKESFVLKPTIKGKDTKATFKSSNSSVATVSESGKVVAKKKGTTTITVSANGVNATCKVTVKSVPKGSSTTTQTIKNPTTGKNETVTVVKPSRPSGGGSSTSAKATTSREAFNLINAERQKAGLSVLSYASDWTNVALNRAKEATTNFSHDGLNKYFKPYTVGECLARLGSNNVPSRVVDGWMNSSSHRAILMDPENTKMIVAKCGNCWVALVQ